MKLSEQLIQIAQGEAYYESALYDALHHPLATHNDRITIKRYLYGSQTSADRFRLQDLALEIAAYDENKQDK